MATAPVFTATPRLGLAQLTVANTNRDGTGTLVSVFAAGASGSRLEHIDIAGVGSVTAGMIRFLLYDGTNYRLVKEVAVTATTPSSSAAGWSTTIDLSTNAKTWLLPSGYTLYASTEVAETFNIFAFGGDF